MGIKLSHTAKQKYLNCPLSYYMHYMLGFREEVIGSALVFGNAVDEALNHLLLNPNEVLKSIEIFNNKWMTQTINGVETIIPQSDKIRYSKADLDETLLPEKMDTKVNPAWYSLKEKGRMFIEAYSEQIMPQIKKVHEVQKFFSIPNGVGDQIIGFIDLIVEFNDGRLLILDNKTSSVAYKENLTEIDEDKLKQLAVYQEAMKNVIPIDGVGFVTLLKNIRKKKEPRVRTQVIVGKIDSELVDQTLDEFDDVLYKIRMGEFPSNHPHCNSYFGDCICNKYAPSGGEDTSGLVQVKRKSK